MDSLRINADRLWSSLMELARIGATPKGGVKRLTLTDEDRRARDLFARWAREAGLAVEVDAIGNVFARRAGTDPSLPPVAMGSHIDSQPSGGKFDGAYGVMAGARSGAHAERRTACETERAVRGRDPGPTRRARASLR
jgi:beta-ureidopropionase / N-carbamoyl-L-amino-acid hydrolase